MPDQKINPNSKAAATLFSINIFIFTLDFYVENFIRVQVAS